MRRAVLALVAVLLAASAASARAATPSTVTQRGDATHDNRVTGAPEPPLGVRWAVDLGAPVSYPVIAEGGVFVTVRSSAGPAYGTTAVALDLATGSVRWTRPVPATYYWSALAYDQGRLFLLDVDGRVSALSPASGATLWSTQLSQYSFSTPPVVYGGHIYLTGAGTGPTAYAVRQSDGGVAWERPLASGAGSPAVDAGSVYVSMSCQHAVALDRATGAVRWEHRSYCSGGGDSTAALHGGRMYPLGDDAAIYDAATGARVGEASFHGYVGFGEGVAYVPWLGGIRAVDAASWAQRWRVAGDGYDVGEAPLVAADHIYVGSEDGYVAALARSDGSVRWCASTAGIPVMGWTGTSTGPTRDWARATGTSWSQRGASSSRTGLAERRRRRAAAPECSAAARRSSRRSAFAPSARTSSSGDPSSSAGRSRGRPGRPSPSKRTRGLSMAAGSERAARRRPPTGASR